MQNNARTHRSTPCAGREAFGNQRELVRKRDLASRGGRSPLPTGGRSRLVCPRRRGEVTPPYGCNTGSAKQRADVPKAWPPPTKFRSEIWGVGHRHRPLRKDGTPDLPVPRGAATSHPCDSGMVSSKGRASALPLVVSRGAGEKFEIPQIFSWGSPLIDSGPLPAGRTAPAGRGISPRPEGDAACQASSGSQSLFSLQKPRGM